jgi:hypothetical protein
VVRASGAMGNAALMNTRWSGRNSQQSRLLIGYQPKPQVDQLAVDHAQWRNLQRTIAAAPFSVSSRISSHIINGARS